MELREFAEKYRVKMTAGKQDTEDLVLGKFGEIAGVYTEQGLMRLRLLAVPRDNASMNKALNARKQQAKAAGFLPLHVSDFCYESIWGFPAESAELCKRAIELVHPRRKKVMPPLSEERKAALVATLALARQQRTQAIV
jgi:hypothetical protein